MDTLRGLVRDRTMGRLSASGRSQGGFPSSAEAPCSAKQYRQPARPPPCVVDVVEPGSDPSAITIGIEDADSAELDGAGTLVLHTPGRNVRHLAPAVYQEVEGIRQPVDGAYVLAGTGSFKLAFMTQADRW